MRKTVEIWGILPPPAGGVSIYCKRLSESLLENGKDVTFLNFSKSASSEAYVRNVRCAVLELLRLPFVTERIIHVQFRNPVFLSLLCLSGWKHDIVITLHNRKTELQHGISKLLLQMFFKRVKYVILNDVTFLPILKEKYSLDSEKAVILPAFIPPRANERRGLTPEIEDFVSGHSIILSANASILIRNSWGDVYGMDQLIPMMDFLVNQEKLDVGLVFMLSEIGDEAYWMECLDRIGALGLKENFLISLNSPANGFEVWERSDVFIRPTMTDMEGISVKEALTVGTPVVASSVCKRPDECLLYEPGNVDQLCSQVLSLIREPKRIQYSSQVDAVHEIGRLYEMLELK